MKLTKAADTYVATLRKAPSTVRAYRFAVHLLLERLMQSGVTDLDTLNSGTREGTLIAAVATIVPQRVRSEEDVAAMRYALVHIAGIRSFVRWLEATGRADIRATKFEYQLREMLPKFTAPQREVDCDAIGALVSTLASTPAHTPVQKRDKAIVLTLAASGIRVSELCDLRWRDVDLEGQTLCVYRGKGGRTRQALINRASARALGAWWGVTHPAKGEEEGPQTRLGGEEPVFGLTPRTVRRVIAGLSNSDMLAGIPSAPITPHSFRHALATNLITKGVPAPEVRDIMGHRSLDTTLGYVHLSQSHIQGELPKGGWSVNQIENIVLGAILDFTKGSNAELAHSIAKAIEHERLPLQRGMTPQVFRNHIGGLLDDYVGIYLSHLRSAEAHLPEWEALRSHFVEKFIEALTIGDWCPSSCTDDAKVEGHSRS